MTQAYPPYQPAPSDGPYPYPYPPSGSGAPAGGGGGSQPSYSPYPYQPVPEQTQGPQYPQYSHYPHYPQQPQYPPYQQAYPQPIPPGPVPGSAPAQPPRRRTGLIVLIIVLVVMLTAGGGTAAWWFLLRDSGSIIDPTNMVVPADDWAAGAKRTGSSTIKKDATIAVSPNGSFLVALSKDSSGTGRSSRGATRLLPDRRAGE